MKFTTQLKAAAAIGAGALLAVAVPLAASAHVTVTPNAAAAGSYSVLTFKVPNESATASTVAITVELPVDHPFASVSYIPVAGWTTGLTKQTLAKPVKIGENEITEAVTSVTWTAAAGSGITAGQLQLFPLSVGPVPDTGSVKLVAVQTYSDGTVVRWDGGADAEHPAPTLYINDTPAISHDDDGDGDAATVTATESQHPASTVDPIGRGLGIGGLALGAVGVTLAIVTLRRRASE
ncbi:MAG: hypothetical protein JWO10_672 [Microbacteriaceae bacterium]|nr:hypothetical protein [Microbacteriaceae bacterium]